MHLLLSFLMLLTPATNVPYPAEDDARVDAVLTVTQALTGSDYLIYESGRDKHGQRIVFAGVGLPGECSFGAYWTRATRDWTDLMLECD